MPGPTVTVTEITRPPVRVIDTESLEGCFQTKVNAERAKIDRPPLPRTSYLDAASAAHSSRMADDGTIYHSSGPPKGYRWAWGENVGMGPAEGNDGPGGESGCDTIHAAFMASEGHRSNILDPDWRTAGYGVVQRGDTIFVTEQFSGATRSQQAAFFNPPSDPPCTCR